MTSDGRLKSEGHRNYREWVFHPARVSDSPEAVLRLRVRTIGDLHQPSEAPPFESLDGGITGLWRLDQAPQCIWERGRPLPRLIVQVSLGACLTDYP